MRTTDNVFTYEIGVPFRLNKPQSKIVKDIDARPAFVKRIAPGDCGRSAHLFAVDAGRWGVFVAVDTPCGNLCIRAFDTKDKARRWIRRSPYYAEAAPFGCQDTGRDDD